MRESSVTLPVSRRSLGFGVAAGVPLVVSGAIELARRPLIKAPVNGPELLGTRLVIDASEIGPVHVRHIAGTDPWSIVFVHGWSGSADVTWHAVAPQLEGGPTMWLIDLPGHGEAPREGKFDLTEAAHQVAAVVDVAAMAGPVTLVGYSMGGAASMLGFYLGILDNVDRYFAVATADRFSTFSLSAKLWAARIIGAGDRSPFILRQAWKRARVSKREMVSWILQNRPSSRVLSDTAAELSNFDLSVAEVPFPEQSEWIIADADTVISVAEQIASAGRHHVPIVRLDATHAVAMEHPAELARILRTQRMTPKLTESVT